MVLAAGLLLGGCATWSGEFAPEAPHAAKRPNLIIIMTDDQGYGDLGVQPRLQEIETPNLDRLALEGIRMTDAYSNAPVCSPSRAALLTGRYQQFIGYYDNWESQVGFHADEIILPQYLKEAGYRTGICGKWHMGWFEHNHPLAKGFDDHFGFSGGMHDYFAADIGETWQGGAHDVNFVEHNGERRDSIVYMTRDVTDHALDFIADAGDEPFFLYLPYTTPHTPLQAKEEDLARYAGRDDMDTNRKVVRAMYDSLDRNVGRLLDYLDDTGLAENTMIVFYGDNGGLASGCDNYVFHGSKGYLSEGGIRVPFLARWPAVLPAGTVYTKPTLHIDVMPTMLAAAGVTIPDDASGVNLLPHWLGETATPPHVTLHWQMHHTAMNRWAIREGDWKLVQARNIEGLFNLADDPSESNDLREAHPEVAERLRARHEEWRKSTIPSRVTPETRRMNGWEIRFAHELHTPQMQGHTILRRLEREQEGQTQ